MELVKLLKITDSKNLKTMNNMEFIIGFVTGAFIMWAIAKRLQVEWKKQIEKLKDFDVWKEWKNEN